MVAMVPNTPRYFTVEPLPVAAEPLASPWICAMKVQATKVTRIGFVFVTQEYFNTCSRTLAVSKGKVSRSAMQAAVPAPTNFTAAEGGTSAGLNPTIFHSVFLKKTQALYLWTWTQQDVPAKSDRKKFHKHTAFRDKCFLFETASLNLTHESYIPPGRQVLLVLWICFTRLILASFTHYASNASSWCVPWAHLTPLFSKSSPPPSTGFNETAVHYVLCTCMGLKNKHCKFNKIKF